MNLDELDKLDELISQRDELLEACRAALALLESVRVDYGADIADDWGDEGRDELIGTIDKLNAAIQKARQGA